MTVTAFLQARMSSSRLPGKVLADLEGQPMIVRQIERVEKSTLIDELVVLTSYDSSDDNLSSELISRGIKVFRGPLDNVFARFIEALSYHPSEHIVRLTADCPLIDPRVIDETIKLHFHKKADYTSNSLIRRFPRGLDCEVFRSSTLLALAEFELTLEEKEHVTLGIYNRPDVFKLDCLVNNLDESNRRWTVDFQKDLDFARIIFKNLYRECDRFTSDDVRGFLKLHPELENFE